LIYSFIYFCHEPLGVYGHQSPEWTILSHTDCFIQRQVVVWISGLAV